jgi:hypothetical protein
VRLRDVNLVLLTDRADHPDHIAARNWLDTMLTSREQFGVPWFVMVVLSPVVEPPACFPRTDTCGRGIQFHHGHARAARPHLRRAQRQSRRSSRPGMQLTSVIPSTLPKQQAQAEDTGPRLGTNWV